MEHPPPGLRCRHGGVFFFFAMKGRRFLTLQTITKIKSKIEKFFVVSCAFFNSKSTISGNFMIEIE